MSKKYKTKSDSPLRVEEMETVTATQLKNSTADVLERVRTHNAVAITRHEKPSAVLLSWEQYSQLKGGEPEWLGELYDEYYAVLEEMQSPEQKAAAERLFQATPEELGAAAVRGAMRKNGSGYNKR
jgi:prevent-host-death family protein